MIAFGLLLAVAASAPVPALPAGTLITACEAGLSGDQASAISCKTAIDEIAVSLKSDATASGCLVQPAYDSNAAVWAFMDWIALNPQEPASDARMSVMAALVAKWPCGWSDGLSE